MGAGNLVGQMGIGADADGRVVRSAGVSKTLHKRGVGQHVEAVDFQRDIMLRSQGCEMRLFFVNVVRQKRVSETHAYRVADDAEIAAAHGLAQQLKVAQPERLTLLAPDMQITFVLQTVDLMHRTNEKIPVMPPQDGLNLLVLLWDKVDFHTQTHVALCLLPCCAYSFNVVGKSEQGAFLRHVVEQGVGFAHLENMLGETEDAQPACASHQRHLQSGTTANVGMEIGIENHEDTFPLLYISDNRDSKAVSVILVHWQEERCQARVAGDEAVVFGDAVVAFILGRLEDPAAANAVIRDDDAAGAAQTQGRFEVLWVRRLVGVDEDEIKGGLVLKPWQQVEGLADAHLGTIGDARVCEGIAHHLGVGRVHFQRNQPTALRQGARQPDAAIARQRAELKNFTRIAGGGEQLQEASLYGRNLDWRQPCFLSGGQRVPQSFIFRGELLANRSLNRAAQICLLL